MYFLSQQTLHNYQYHSLIKKDHKIYIGKMLLHENELKTFLDFLI